MMKKIPLVLIFSRFVIGIAIIILSASKIRYYSTIAIVLFSIGLLSDIFDGIIARRLNISSERLRRLDSGADQVFFIFFGIATYIQCPDFFRSNAVKLVILLSTEAMAYLVCFIRFRKEVATHSIGAKIWTLVLFATLIEIILHCRSVVLFNFCFWIGMISRAEIIAIILILKKWTNDVPGIYQAIQLRKGKAIKRNKLFNG